MKQYEPYYIDPNDPDDWKKAFRDAATIMFFFVVGIALCALLSSCSTAKSVTESTDSTSVRHSDTVRIVEWKESKVVEFRDRRSDNLYIVNPLTGDTVKQIVKEKELIYYSQEQHDSIDRYKAKCDSLLNIIKRNTLLTKEKPLNWWQKFKCDTYMYVFIAFLATMITWVVSFYIYRNKNPK